MDLCKPVTDSQSPDSVFLRSLTRSSTDNDGKRIGTDWSSSLTLAFKSSLSLLFFTQCPQRVRIKSVMSTSRKLSSQASTAEWTSRMLTCCPRCKLENVDFTKLRKNKSCTALKWRARSLEVPNFPLARPSKDLGTSSRLNGSTKIWAANWVKSWKISSCFFASSVVTSVSDLESVIDNKAHIGQS